jgi:hypothetical protein
MDSISIIPIISLDSIGLYPKTTRDSIRHKWLYWDSVRMQPYITTYNKIHNRYNIIMFIIKSTVIRIRR